MTRNVFLCRPETHVDADLGNQTKSCRLVNPIGLSQIHAADSKRFFSDVEFHLISLLVDPTGGEHNKDKKNLELDRVYREKVDRNELGHMIGEERSPAWESISSA